MSEFMHKAAIGAATAVTAMGVAETAQAANQAPTPYDGTATVGIYSTPQQKIDACVTAIDYSLGEGGSMQLVDTRHAAFEQPLGAVEQTTYEDGQYILTGFDCAKIGVIRAASVQATRPNSAPVSDARLLAVGNQSQTGEATLTTKTAMKAGQVVKGVVNIAAVNAETHQVLSHKEYSTDPITVPKNLPAVKGSSKKHNKPQQGSPNKKHPNNDEVTIVLTDNDGDKTTVVITQQNN
jgi:hypothetical protein